MLARSRTVLVLREKEADRLSCEGQTLSCICMRIWSDQWQKVEVADIWVCEWEKQQESGL